MQVKEAFPLTRPVDLGSLVDVDAAIQCGVAAAIGALAVVGCRILSRRRARPIPLEDEPESASEPPVRLVVRFRRETWTMADGADAALLVVATHEACIAHVVVMPRDGTPARFGRDGFSGDAILSDRDALAAALNPGAMTIQVLDEMCLSGGTLDCPWGNGPDELARQVGRLAYTMRTLNGNWLPHKMMGRLVEAMESSFSYPDAKLDIGHASEQRSGDTMSDVCRRIPSLMAAPGAAGTPPEILKIDGENLATDALLFEDMARMEAFLAPWHAAVTAMVRPEGVREFGRAAWTGETVTYLSAPGEAASRRIQAARLQPAFLPTVARDPDLVALVDAGMPFEAALTERVNAAATAVGLPALDRTRMRRMRTYGIVPPRDGAAHIGRVIAAAGSLPIEWLPVDESGWRALVPNGIDLFDRLVETGLDLADLTRNLKPGWGLGDIAPGLKATTGADVGIEIRRMAMGYTDMVRRMTETLVVPANPRATQVTASRMLGAGRSARAVLGLQTEWHERLTAFDRGLPDSVKGELLVWPALFEPMTPLVGIELH